MIRQTITAIAVSVAFASPLFAGEAVRQAAVQQRTDEIDALQKANQKLAEAEQGAGKQARAQVVRRQRQHVQDLLDQLNAGQRVDPADVDRVLQQAEHPF